MINSDAKLAIIAFALIAGIVLLYIVVRKISSNPRLARITAAVLVGGFFLVMSYFQFKPFPLPFFIGAFGSILLGTAVWFVIEYFSTKPRPSNALLTASICAIAGAATLMSLFGGGGTSYYKIIYPLGESEVKSETSGGGYVYIILAGLAGIIYWGWGKAGKAGWSIIKYAGVVLGIFFGVVLIIIIRASIILH